MNPATRPLFDPESVPLDAAFAAALPAPAVAPTQLAVAALRARFAAPPPWAPELVADPRLFDPDQPLRPAAVLLPLVARPHGVQVMLTRRTAHLHDHPGQISFPGGRVEQGDADAVATALRETHEETGLAPSAVQVLGRLPLYVTATGYQVTPVVGLIEAPPPLATLAFDRFEVEELFEVPLAFVADPRHHERRVWQLEGHARAFYAMPFNATRRYFIWGATAAMLRNFYHFLAA